MPAQFKPALGSFSEDQIGERSLLTMRNHVHGTGRNLETIVVVLSKSTPCEGHSLIH